MVLNFLTLEKKDKKSEDSFTEKTRHQCCEKSSGDFLLFFFLIFSLIGSCFAHFVNRMVNVEDEESSLFQMFENYFLL